MPASTVPPVRLVRSPAAKTDVLVLARVGAEVVGLPDALAASFADRHGASVAEVAARVGLSANKPLSTRTLPPVGGTRGPVLVLVDLNADPAERPDPELLRRAAGAGVRKALAGDHDRPLSIAVSFGPTTPAEVGAVVEGALLGHYRYAPVSSTTAPETVSEIAVVAPTQKTFSAAADEAGTLAAAVIAARNWINVPPNLLYPESFADDASSYLRAAKVGVEVLDDKALAKGGYGGILAVGGGSSRPPRLVRASYAPRGAKAHLVLVGKGITFDSGGLNLKPADNMYTMKCDMSGAAAVLAATRAIAELGLKVKVTTYAAMAENLPGHTAFRPSDVLTIYGGTTVENGNSDAEGRLVMADALARSAEDGPDVVVDVATLTGACVTALGDKTSGVLTNGDAVADQVLAASRRAGESFWRLPIPEETRGRLDSKVADLRSTASDRPAGASVAAAFLREFVPDGAAWAHLDIAGPAFNSGAPSGYTPSGGTGVAVRTLVRLAQDLAG